MSARTRQRLAIAACLGTAAGAAYLIAHGGSRAWILFDTGCAWSYTGYWLGRRLAVFGVDVARLPAEAARHRLTPTGVAGAMWAAGVLLWGAAAAVGLWG